MQEHYVDMYRHEVAAGQYRHRLDESVQRMKGEPCERSNYFRLMVDRMKMSVYFGVV